MATGNVTLSGNLSDSSGPISGASIGFTDDASDAIPAATTDASGNFTSSAPVTAGARTFTAKFAGSATDKAATATANATVLAGTTLTLTVTVQ